MAPSGAALALVSGGPDSLALLILTAAARPGEVEAATVDHAFAPRAEAKPRPPPRICAQLGVPHAILTADGPTNPLPPSRNAPAPSATACSPLGDERGLDAILTGHHADDQAETLLMRLNRGAGVRGLGACG